MICIYHPFIMKKHSATFQKCNKFIFYRIKFFEIFSLVLAVWFQRQLSKTVPKYSYHEFPEKRPVKTQFHQKSFCSKSYSEIYSLLLVIPQKIQ